MITGNECEGCVYLIIPLVLIWGTVLGLAMAWAVGWFKTEEDYRK